MASSSNNSSNSSQIQNSGSEGDLQQMMDERKRKRMASNRESARRSRMRKQKHIEDLMVQVDQLKRDNNQILQTTNLTTQQFVNVEAENSVLKAQMNELNQRLNSLNDILNYMNTLTIGVNGNGNSNGNCDGIGNAVFDDDSLDIISHDNMGDFGVFNGYYGNFTQNNSNSVIGSNNPWNLVYLNQPIMASADVLQY